MKKSEMRFPLSAFSYARKYFYFTDERLLLIVFQITSAANSEPCGDACCPSGAYISVSGWAC